MIKLCQNKKLIIIIAVLTLQVFITAVCFAQYCPEGFSRVSDQIEFFKANAVQFLPWQKAYLNEIKATIIPELPIEKIFIIEPESLLSQQFNLTNNTGRTVSVRNQNGQVIDRVIFINSRYSNDIRCIHLFIHEAIHLVYAPKDNRKLTFFERQLCEGITEYYTQKFISEYLETSSSPLANNLRSYITREFKIKYPESEITNLSEQYIILINSSYQRLVNNVTFLANKFGEDIILDALKNNNYYAIYDLVHGLEKYHKLTDA